MTEHTVTSRVRIRSSKACTACRQVKLRCDANDRFPEPCTRCQKLGRSCMNDPSFKRVSTRNQLERVTGQLAELRQRISVAPQVSTISTLQQPDDTSLQDDRRRQNQPDTEHATKSFSVSKTSSESDDVFRIKTAGTGTLRTCHLHNIELTATQVLDLFSLFVTRQYHFLPVLNTTMRIDTMHSRCPLLFWTIIVIASRHHHDHCHLTPLLIGPYEDFIARAIMRAPLPLSSIQAILLLCYWPFPCPKQIFDPSWNQYGLALCAARFQALDAVMKSPLSTARQEDNQVRARTWLGCFYVGTILALHWGVAAPIQSPSDLYGIKNLMETVTVHPSFLVQLRILHKLVEYRSTSVGSVHATFDLSAMRLYEAKIENTTGSGIMTTDDAAEICQSRAKLSLYASGCMAAPYDTRSIQEGIQGEDDIPDSIALSALRSASKLIQAFARLVEWETQNTDSARSTTDQRNYLLLIPKQYHAALNFAAFFLLKFCVFNERLSIEDRGLAENMVRTAYDLCIRVSAATYDEAARAAEVIKVLSRAGQWKMIVKDRSCASVWLDSIRRGSELRGRNADDRFPEVLSKEGADSSQNNSMAQGETASAEDCPVQQSSVHNTADPSWLAPFSDYPDIDWLFDQSDDFLTENQGEGMDQLLLG